MSNNPSSLPDPNSYCRLCCTVKHCPVYSEMAALWRMIPLPHFPCTTLQSCLGLNVCKVPWDPKINTRLACKTPALRGDSPLKTVTERKELHLAADRCPFISFAAEQTEAAPVPRDLPGTPLVCASAVPWLLTETKPVQALYFLPVIYWFIFFYKIKVIFIDFQLYLLTSSQLYIDFYVDRVVYDSRSFTWQRERWDRHELVSVTC